MAEKDIKKARRTILQAYYTKKKVFYLLNVKSEGSKYPLSLIVARSSIRQTYQVKGTDIRGVTIKERKARGYVPYMGSYLYIDEEGRVLEVAGSCRDALPLVKGLKFDSFTEGEILPVQNTDALAVILEISQLMEKYELLDEVVEIDVSKPKDIYAYVNQVQIHLGNMTNGDMKIQYMQQIVKTIPKEDRGILDLSGLDNPKANVTFQYLT